MNLSRFGDNTISLPRHHHRLSVKPQVPVYLRDNYSNKGVPCIDAGSSHTGRGQGQKLVCHLCQAMITDDAQRVDFMGSNLHCRTNPAGFSYSFACFSAAPGCSTAGQTSMEHSWFAGYTWQLVLCGDCGEHLGWLFRGNERCFGLIQGRVIPGGDQI